MPLFLADGLLLFIVADIECIHFLTHTFLHLAELL